MSTITTTITAEHAALLDAAERMWRVAVTVDDQTLYRIADESLTALLVSAYGEADGRAVRDEMADNFEGWSYNQRVIADRRAYEATVCSDCSGGYGDHEDGCPGSPAYYLTVGTPADEVRVLAGCPAERPSDGMIRECLLGAEVPLTVETVAEVTAALTDAYSRAAAHRARLVAA